MRAGLWASTPRKRKSLGIIIPHKVENNKTNMFKPRASLYIYNNNKILIIILTTIIITIHELPNVSKCYNLLSPWNQVFWMHLLFAISLYWSNVLVTTVTTICYHVYYDHMYVNLCIHTPSGTLTQLGKWPISRKYVPCLMYFEILYDFT